MEYSEIFAHRGDAYHQAMRRVPAARDAEFKELFRHRPVRRGQTVLDVPSGGGYLARTLPAGICVTELELTSGFSGGVRVVDTYSNWGVGRFDHTVCLAGLHHIEDQDRFVEQLVCHTKPGGIVHIADVDRSQPIASYLDGFVGCHNSTGHEGRYLSAWSFSETPGARLIASEIRPCPWQFDSEEQLLDFCGCLFGLIGHSRDELREQLLRCAGIDCCDGVWRIGWRLRYIDLEVVDP